jgi:hypothetical protein
MCSTGSAFRRRAFEYRRRRRSGFCRACFMYTRCIAGTIRNAQEEFGRLPGEGDMTFPQAGVTPMSSRPAPYRCRIRVNRSDSPARPTGADPDRGTRLNRERPHSRRFAAPRGHSRFNGVLHDDVRRRHRRMDAATVLVGVKGAFASLTGCAALDPACARCTSCNCRWRQER